MLGQRNHAGRVELIEEVVQGRQAVGAVAEPVAEPVVVPRPKSPSRAQKSEAATRIAAAWRRFQVRRRYRIKPWVIPSTKVGERVIRIVVRKEEDASDLTFNGDRMSAYSPSGDCWKTKLLSK